MGTDRVQEANAAVRLDEAGEGAVRRRRTALTGSLLVAAAVVFTALNLRPAISSVGPVLDEMRVSLGAPVIWAGLLTTMPGLCFAGAGLCAPWFARKVGTVTAIGIALGVLTCGLLLRVVGGQLVVLGGTLVATSGIAIANVLLPVVIKDSFPARVGLMMGMYTAALQSGGAAGSALTPPVHSWFGYGINNWRPALASWAVVAAIALVVWAIAARRHSRSRAPTPEGAAARPRSMLRSPVAWAVTVSFGVQALLAYVAMGWLPQVLMDAGTSRATAGLLLGLVSIIAVPISISVPTVAARQRSQTWWVVGLSVFALAGILGLMIAPGAAPVLWTVLLGIGMSVFSLVLTMIALRSRTPADTAQLSAMAQGIGYLLAALGPFLFGLLYAVTGGWTVPFVILVVAVTIQAITGGIAGRPRYA